VDSGQRAGKKTELSRFDQKLSIGQLPISKLSCAEKAARRHVLRLQAKLSIALQSLRIFFRVGQSSRERIEDPVLGLVLSNPENLHQSIRFEAAPGFSTFHLKSISSLLATGDL
jgi:hypothetical protein